MYSTEPLKQFYNEACMVILKCALLSIKEDCKLRFLQLGWMFVSVFFIYIFIRQGGRFLGPNSAWSSFLRTTETENCMGTPTDRKLKFTVHILVVMKTENQNTLPNILYENYRNKNKTLK